MPRPRQPVELLLVKGKKHLTKSEIEDRKAREIRAPSDQVRAPKYLDKEGKREFNRLAKQLLELNVMTNLDVDALARFIFAHRMYLTVTNELLNRSPVHDVRRENDDGVVTITKLSSETYSDLLLSQDKLFKQCRQAASDLGLTISSRAKLVVPKKDEPTPKTKEERLFGDRL